MYCDQCGGLLQHGQLRCVKCGKPVVGPSEQRQSRVQEHIRLLGILWMAYSSLIVLGGIVLLIVANTLFGRVIHLPNGPGPEVTSWLRPFLTFIAGVVVVKGLAGFCAGWGIAQREPWGRMVGLVVGFLTLFNVPLGTALGIYTLWVLLPSQSEEEYRALAAAA